MSAYLPGEGPSYSPFTTTPENAENLQERSLTESPNVVRLPIRRLIAKALH